MRTITDKNFWDKLDASAVKHLKEMEIHDLAGLNRTFQSQQESRDREPRVEPCWTCKAIARTLGAIK